jgi:hypothetical protein
VGFAVQNAVWFVAKHLAAFVSPQTQKLVKNKPSLSNRIEIEIIFFLNLFIF